MKKPARKEKPEKLTQEELRCFLETQEKKRLVDLLMEQAMEDEPFWKQLTQAAVKGFFSGVPVTALEESIRQALDFSGYDDDDYYGSGYSDEIKPIIVSLKTFLANGHVLEVLGLTEYAIEKVEAALDEGHDSEEGELHDTLEDLAKLHASASREALSRSLMTPQELADRLFALETHLGGEAISNVAETYANVLDEQGLLYYGQLVQAEWDRLPSLAPGEKESHPGSRSRLTHMMESLAQQSGDLKFLVDVKSRDLSAVTQFLTIATLYREAGQFEEALNWSERGAQAFPWEERNFALNQLNIFLAEEYHRKGRHSEAMALIWKIFRDSPEFETYKMLKAHVSQAEGAEDIHWTLWREKALAQVRRGTEARKQKTRIDYWGKPLDHSDLVQIFLWEGEVDAAWQEARQGGCSKDLWLALARELEASRAEDAISIYRQWIEPTIDRKNNDAYKEAVGYLRKIYQLMTPLNQKQEFKDYLSKVRVAHKTKRNLIKLLDKEKWRS
jgi:uncharacterized Zn finger protein